jgi:Tol biopolymer transport system component
MVGTTIGQYRVVERLGAGGMGEVYRAEDTRLGRYVAIKALPESLSGDPDKLSRLEREARTLAALNHPNIAAIYGLEELAGRRYLILELVPGQTLAERIDGAGLPLEEVLDLCRQIAAGLEAAHDKGVVHRDIKPANVMVTPDGVVKLLDFGLAKAVPSGAAEAETASLQMEAVAGTVAYMSPEQVRGAEVDPRTDIWAFGCVLYEVLTGRRLFSAPTTADTMMGILSRDADLSGLPPETPPHLRRLLERCLRRDPKRRLRHIGDARLELEEPGQPTAIAARPGRPRLAWLALPLAAAAAIGGWWARGRLTPNPESPMVRVKRLTDLPGLELTPAISPDGKSVAFVAESRGRHQIYIRLLGGGTPLAITRDDTDHMSPRWAPDSSSLIYFTPGPTGEHGTIWEIPALGGVPQRIAAALAPGDFSRDGKQIALFRSQPGAVDLVAVTRDGSSPHIIARLPGNFYENLRWSPDGRWLACIEKQEGVAFADHVIVVPTSGGEMRTLGGDAQIAGLAWKPDSSGFVLSSSRGSTLPYPPTFNLWSVTLDGSGQRQLTFGESTYEGPDLQAGGQIVSTRIRMQSDIWRIPITGAPAENVRNAVRITRQTGQVQTVTINPDESELAFLSDNGGHANIWTVRIATGEMRPATRELDTAVTVGVPVWSPRGDWINFLSNKGTGSFDVTLWLVRPDGSDARDLKEKGVWVCWSGDGEWVYYSHKVKGTFHISKYSLRGGQKQTVREDNAGACQIAADGSALYYLRILNQATFEVRVARPESGESKILGYIDGGRVPVYSVYAHAFLSPDGKWLAHPLLDRSTTNLWALPTSGGEWTKLTDFGSRNVLIARRVAWSHDSRHIYAAVADMDADIVLFEGLL